MTIKLRIVLDHNLDVFRELKISENATLHDLHELLVQSFELEQNEMAAFYLTDNDWEQGQEIPLFAMQNDTKEMKDIFSKDIFQSNKRLLYINNFLIMWRFMIEVIEINKDETIQQSQVLLSFGTMPQELPRIQFVSDTNSSDEDLFDNDHDEFSEFENYEEY